MTPASSAASAGGGGSQTPPGRRPGRPSDRAREALFNSLERAAATARRAPRVLDLYAGSGAVGLEALRGAPPA